MSQAQFSSKNLMISSDDVEIIVKNFISDFFYMEVSSLNRNLRFEDDICADEVIFADCVDALEEEFAERTLSFRIDPIERNEIDTIGHLIDVICKYVLVEGGES